jgi:hypothetical protein
VALTHTYDLGPDLELKVWEGPFCRHEGQISWRCGGCHEEGSGSFKTVTRGEDLLKGDLDEVLAMAEADHAVRCSGSLSLQRFHTKRYVQYSRADIGFNGDVPQLFIVSGQKSKPGRYEDLTTYEEIKA